MGGKSQITIGEIGGGLIIKIGQARGALELLVDIVHFVRVTTVNEGPAIGAQFACDIEMVVGDPSQLAQARLVARQLGQQPVLRARKDFRFDFVQARLQREQNGEIASHQPVGEMHRQRAAALTHQGRLLRHFVPQVIGADRRLVVACDEETRADEHRELQHAEFDILAVGIQTAQQDEQKIIERLDLGRMPIAQRVLHRERMEIEGLLQELLLGLGVVLGDVHPQQRMSFTLPARDQAFVACHQRAAQRVEEISANHAGILARDPKVDQ